MENVLKTVVFRGAWPLRAWLLRWRKGWRAPTRGRPGWSRPSPAGRGPWAGRVSTAPLTQVDGATASLAGRFPTACVPLRGGSDASKARGVGAWPQSGRGRRAPAQRDVCVTWRNPEASWGGRGSLGLAVRRAGGPRPMDASAKSWHRTQRVTSGM